MGGTGWFKNNVIYHILIDRFAGIQSSKNWEQPIFLGGGINAIFKKFHFISY